MLDNIKQMLYNILVKRLRETKSRFTKGKQKEVNEMNERREESGMTNAQLDAFLETLARLIESDAENIEQAAEIVRNAKTAEK